MKVEFNFKKIEQNSLKLFKLKSLHNTLKVKPEL